MKTYPIFRLTIFLTAGILFANTFWTENGFDLIAPLLAVLLTVLLFLYLILKRHLYSARWVFGAGVAVFMFLVGVIWTNVAWEDVKVDWPSEKKAYRALVKESLREKARTYQAVVDIEGKKVWLYLSKDSLSASLSPGDGLYVYTQIKTPENREDTLTFDYAGYLYHEGVSGTAYVAADAWKKTGEEAKESLKVKALLLRESILSKYRQWGVGEEQLPVLSALTLGYKDGLDKDIRDAYSIAGISHVLALSGMHIGIIWFLLNGLLCPWENVRFRWLKSLSVVVALWVFAFVVGLEASVVRAVVMCMLMELGRLSGFKSFSMNTLAITAFFMLLYRPFYLFDVGFQLSFVAVASILFLYPLIFHTFPIKNRVGRWVWGMLSVSVAAQLGTSPLVMYYFSSFSVYFLLTNLLAAVLVPFIIYIAFLMFLTASFPDLQGYVVSLLNELVASLNGLAEWTSSLPYATFSFVMWHPVEIVFFYMMLFAWTMFWKNKKRKWLLRGLALCACLLGLHLFLLWRQNG